MKRLLSTIVCLFSLAAVASAAELFVDDLVSDASKYVGKTVTVKGNFLYSEPMRESFAMTHAGVKLEIFYRDLAPNDKLFITSLHNNAKTAMVVTGILKQYANSQRSYFMDASTLQHEGSAAASPAPASALSAVSYLDILQKPADYVNKPVTMRGAFVYSEPMRQSFTFEQNGKTMEVLLSDLSKLDRDRVLEQKKNSKVPVVITGLLQNYANDNKRFYIAAYSVSLEN